MKQLHYHAWISWLAPKKGGWPSVPVGRVRLDVRFESQKDWPAVGWTFVIEPTRSFENGRLQIAKVDFLVDAAPHDLLIAGARFELLDGRRVIANGMIVDADSTKDVSEHDVEEVLWV